MSEYGDMHFFISLFHKAVQFSRFFKFQINDLWTVTGCLGRKCYFFSISPTFPSAGCLPNCISHSSLTFASSNQLEVASFTFLYLPKLFLQFNSFLHLWAVLDGLREDWWERELRILFYSTILSIEVERHWVICGDGGNSLPHPLLNFYLLKIT